MSLNKNSIAVFFLLNFTALCFTQQNKVLDSLGFEQLDPVIITATRTVRQLSSLPMPVLLIDKKQIEQAGSTRLSDILLEQTGINFTIDQSGFRGVQLQGLSAEYTMILIDGVPLIGRRSGNLDLSRITVNNIKQIEIVKGPSSSLYGSEALGGVINIITEKPKKNTLKGDVSYLNRFLARNEEDINTNFVFRKNKFGLNAGINFNASSGFDVSPNDNINSTNAYNNYTASINSSYQFSKKLNAFFSQRFFYESQEPSNSQNNNSIQRDWNSNIEFHHKTSSKTTISYTFYNTQFNTESDINGAVSFFKETLLRPEIRTVTTFKRSSLNTGIGVNFNTLDRTFFDKKENFTANYAFAQYDFSPLKELNIIAGARFDLHNKYKSAFSPKLSASYKVNDWLQAKGSIGYGFKAPDFRQLFFNFNNVAGGYQVLGIQTIHELYGNTPNVSVLPKDLKPENSIGTNIGFTIKPNTNITIGINAFRNDIRDLINTIVLQGGIEELGNINVFTYENRDEVFTQGIELDVDYKISNAIRFMAGYQYLEAKDKEELDKIKSGTVFIRNENLQQVRINESNYFGLANRSKHTANAKLFYTNNEHKFNANLRALYSSKYALFDTNNSANIIDEFDSFVAGNIQFNMAIEKTIFQKMSLQIGVDNFLNEQGRNNTTLFPNNDAVLFIGRNFYARARYHF
jgi:outer membrane receptor for ferrienterochelin and colicins